MTTPPIKVEVAFTSSPFTLTWTDITDFVSSVEFERGRANEFSDIEAGTGALVLDNSDGRFTPRNGSSPYFPYVIPRRAVRISTDLGGGYEPLWSGYVKDWPVSFPGGNDMPEMTVPLVDAYELLGNYEIQPVWTAELLSRGTPYAVFPLDDEAGPNVGDLGPNQFTGYGVVAGKSTAGASYAFGSTEIVPGQGTSLRFVGSGASGYALNIPCAKFGRLTGGVSLAFVMQLDVGATGNFFTLYNADGFPYVQITPTRANYYDDNSTPPIQNDFDVFAKTLADGKPHLITVTVRHPLSSNSIIKMNVDGVACVNKTFSLSGRIVDPAVIQLMGNAHKWESGQFCTGNLSGVGVWNDNTTALTVDAAAAKGATTESDLARLQRIVRYSGSGLTLSAAATSSVMDKANWEKGANALTALKEVAQSCGGDIVINASGQAAYVNRTSRYNPAVVTLSSTLFTTEGDIDFHWDSEIYNEVKGTRVGGHSFSVSDSTTITAYDTHSDSFESSVVSDDEVRNAAAWRLRKRKRPMVRCDQVAFNLTTSPATPAQAAALVRATVGSRYSLNGLPALAPLSNATLDFFVEKATHTITSEGGVNKWLITFDITPATFTKVVQLDTTGTNQLGGFGVTTAPVASSSSASITITGTTTWPATPFSALLEDELVTVTTVTSASPNTNLLITRTAPIGHDAGVEFTLAAAGALAY